MDRVELTGTGIWTSRLGFGCAKLLGPIPKDEATRTLETALAEGVTHFDVARAYGSGEVEAVVGAFARRHRDAVTITTKFGIAPRAGVGRHPLVRQVARRAMRLSPGVRRALGRQSAKLATRGQFDPVSARASIETSLRTLGLDHVDVLLLHDATPEDCTPELLELLQGLQAAGTIGCFGVGSGMPRTSAIAEQDGPYAAMLQFPSSGLDGLATSIGEQSSGATITHGSLATLPAACGRHRPHRRPTCRAGASSSTAT